MFVNSCNVCVLCKIILSNKLDLFQESCSVKDSSSPKMSTFIVNKWRYLEISELVTGELKKAQVEVWRGFVSVRR